MPLWSSGCSAGSSPGRLARRPSDACRGPGSDSELSFQNGILPAFLSLPPPRLCNEPFPPGRYFRVLAGGIYIYKLVSTRISVIGVTLCPAPPSGMGWGSACTRVCVHWAPSCTRVYLPVLLCTCVRIYPAIYLSITHRCSSLPILHIQTLLACLVGGGARLSIIQ